MGCQRCGSNSPIWLARCMGRRACLAVYKACSETNHWPDLSSDGVIEIEHWHQHTPSRAWTTGQSVG